MLQSKGSKISVLKPKRESNMKDPTCQRPLYVPPQTRLPAVAHGIDGALSHNIFVGVALSISSASTPRLVQVSLFDRVPVFFYTKDVITCYAIVAHGVCSMLLTFLLVKIRTPMHTCVPAWSHRHRPNLYQLDRSKTPASKLTCVAYIERQPATPSLGGVGPLP